MSSARASCGREFTCVPDISDSLQLASEWGFHFAVVPIAHPRQKREFITGPAVDRHPAFTRADVVLSSQDWSSLVVGKVSPWIDVDSPVEHVRKNSEAALSQELKYAAHLSMPAVLIPVKSGRCISLARVLLSNMMGATAHFVFWIQIPLMPPLDASESNLVENCLRSTSENKIVENGVVVTSIDHIMADGEHREDFEEKAIQTWEWWNNIRTLCHQNKKMALVLQITENLPTPDVLERWYGEPIKAVVIPTRIFITNRRGYPVLSRPHQILVQKLFRYDVQFIISGSNHHGDKGLSAYHDYIQHLNQIQDPLDSVSRFAKGYEDYLQCPLQPLMDNLESQTYEIFEKDPVKYSQYQKAIFYAIQDRMMSKPDDDIIVMVVGAGRGPLVRASLEAADLANKAIRVYAVEKNPNAVVTLCHLKEEYWGDSVTVVACDMRDWKAPEQADILVSELLGSFGDNELSPECLDGAQRFLKDDGISIPKEYTSYLAPLMSHKLHNEVRNIRDADKSPESAYETPYVVRLHNVCLLAEPEPMFTFYHPNKDKAIDNTRYKSITFDITHAGRLHGFAGYFDTVLYGEVTLSILPETHSKGMFSWFPIFFPIKDAIYLPNNCHVTAHFWRLCNSLKVWYEWCVTSPVCTQIHNPSGRSYTIGL